MKVLGALAKWLRWNLRGRPRVLVPELNETGRNPYLADYRANEHYEQIAHMNREARAPCPAHKPQTGRARLTPWPDAGTLRAQRAFGLDSSRICPQNRQAR
jgi:hypothetical protein